MPRPRPKRFVSLMVDVEHRPGSTSRSVSPVQGSGACGPHRVTVAPGHPSVADRGRQRVLRPWTARRGYAAAASSVLPPRVRVFFLQGETGRDRRRPVAGTRPHFEGGGDLSARPFREPRSNLLHRREAFPVPQDQWSMRAHSRNFQKIEIPHPNTGTVEEKSSLNAKVKRACSCDNPHRRRVKAPRRRPLFIAIAYQPNRPQPRSGLPVPRDCVFDGRR